MNKLINNYKNQSFLLLIVSILAVSCTTDHFVNSKDGLKIAYSKYGNGSDLIVFVHGWSCDRSYWDNQIDYFRSDYKVVTIDLGGHGESGTTRENWTISSLGDDVVSVIELFEYENLFVVGHSMGAMVIVDAASKINTPNISLFLVDLLKNKYWPLPEENFESFIKPFRKDFQAQTKKWVSSMFKDGTDPELVNSITSDMSNAPSEIAIPILKDLWVRDFDPTISLLNKKEAKMTLINSDQGKTKEDELKEMGFEITYIPGTGHFIMNEAPNNFNRHLQSLIK